MLVSLYHAWKNVHAYGNGLTMKENKVSPIGPIGNCGTTYMQVKMT